MSSQVTGTQTMRSTSAVGSLPLALSSHLVLGVLCAPGTAAQSLPVQDLGWQLVASSQTGGLDWKGGDRTSLDTGPAVSELRRLTGLTWEQLAAVFGVSRRSLHFWASGKPINAANEEHLRRSLQVIMRADRGSADANRAMLLHDHDGVLPLDLLIRREYGELLRRVGEGPGRPQLRLKPLSRAAWEARKPLPPARLVDALQDRVHVEPGRLLSAAPIRRKREQ